MSKKIKWQVAGLLLAVMPLAAFSGQAYAAQPQSAPQGPNTEQIYTALEVNESLLSFRNPDTGVPRVGTTVLEKAVGGLRCRKTSAVVPEPVPHYQCFAQLTLSTDQAMVLFQLLSTPVLEVAYLDPASGAPRVGVTVMEKSTDDLICQGVAPVIPEPVPTYTCYADISDNTLRRERRHAQWDERDERERHRTTIFFH